jgi:hypothetical protein
MVWSPLNDNLEKTKGGIPNLTQRGFGLFVVFAKQHFFFRFFDHFPNISQLDSGIKKLTITDELIVCRHTHQTVKWSISDSNRSLSCSKINDYTFIQSYLD